MYFFYHIILRVLSIIILFLVQKGGIEFYKTFYTYFGHALFLSLDTQKVLKGYPLGLSCKSQGTITWNFFTRFFTINIHDHWRRTCITYLCNTYVPEYIIGVKISKWDKKSWQISLLYYIFLYFVILVNKFRLYMAYSKI